MTMAQFQADLSVFTLAECEMRRADTWHRRILLLQLLVVLLVVEELCHQVRAQREAIQRVL